MPVTAAGTRLLNMPPDPVIRMKMVTVMMECYNYMGFSFFPAVPWSQMEVPESIPHPQTVMMIGFFEFGDISVHKFTFWASCCMTIVGAVMVYRTRNDIAKNLLMIQIFFEIGAFPIIKKMTAALTCTSMDKWCDSASHTPRRHEVAYALATLGCASSLRLVWLAA
jgi:hypothetical protein